MSDSLKSWAEQQPEFTQYEHDHRPNYIDELIRRWPENKALLEELQNGNSSRNQTETRSPVSSESDSLASRIDDAG